jgi:hypothetical protein
MDIRLEEGHANLTQGLVDLRLRQPPVASKPAECSLEAIGKGLEHGRDSIRVSAGPSRVRKAAVARRK